ncbi:MAG: type II toxin-antitoxin system VapC family toxin [Acidobacteria bacterium]|nr:type II toxin-antitoxin system VapC family toxin [Acidobacteriota bacterium]
MILLDTHALIWLDQDLPALGVRSRRAAEKAHKQSRLAVSAISFWEVAMLVARGRISLDRSVTAWRNDLLELGIEEVALDGETGVRAAELADLHGDPADRILIATAQTRDWTFMTADDRILSWKGALRRLDARR